MKDSNKLHLQMFALATVTRFLLGSSEFQIFWHENPYGTDSNLPHFQKKMGEEKEEPVIGAVFRPG